jgi:hypothetical protein
VVELNDEALRRRTSKYLYDYFGPSVDTGFRVLSACSHRYFTLSVEVAWAMAQCADDAGVDKHKHPLGDLKLLGTPEFKGVWNGREYPLFALDREVEDLVNIALAKIQDRELPAKAVVNLCKECSAKTNWPSALYLPDSKHEQFKTVPKDSLDDLRSNSMDGAETVPVEATGGTESLAADVPMGTPPTIDAGGP